MGVGLEEVGNNIKLTISSSTNNLGQLANLNIITVEIYKDISIAGNNLKSLCFSDTDCLSGYFCQNNVCLGCWPGCNRCISEFTTASTASNCLLDDQNFCSFMSNPDINSGECNLEYLNIAVIPSGNIVVNTPIENPAYGYTIGFWVLSSDLEISKSVTFELTDLIKIQISMSSKKIVVKPFFNNVEINELISSQVNSQKWVHIKAGFQLNNIYNAATNGFIAISYYFSHVIVVDKSEFVFGPHQKIFGASDSYNFSISYDLGSGNRVYIRELTIFTDYIRSQFENM